MKTFEPSRRRFLKQALAGAGAAAFPWIWARRSFAEDAKQLTPPVEIVRNGPAEKRINLLVIGYFWDNETKFLEFVRKSMVEDGLKSKYDALKVTFPFLNLSASIVVGKADPVGLQIRNGAIGGFDREAALKEAAAHKASMVCAVINDPRITGQSMPDVAAGPTALTTLFHEWGHAFGQADEDREDPNNYGLQKYFTLNVDRLATPDAKPRWQPALDQKVAGAKTNAVAGTKGLYRGDEKPCMMISNGDNRGAQYGPVCALGVYLNARRRIGLFESVTEEAESIASTKGQLPGISMLSIPSGAGPCSVRAWFCSGESAELDEIAKKLREEQPGREELSDPKLQQQLEKKIGKPLKKFDLAANKRTRALEPKAAPPPGHHLVVAAAVDPTPGIFMDPEKVTAARKVYRLEVAG